MLTRGKKKTESISNKEYLNIFNQKRKKNAYWNNFTDGDYGLDNRISILWKMKTVIIIIVIKSIQISFFENENTHFLVLLN